MNALLLATALFGCSAVAAANADRILAGAKSDCGQGTGKLFFAGAVTYGSVQSGVAFIEAGGLVLTTASTALASGTALGYAAFGPDPAQTLYYIGDYLLGGMQQVEECLP